MDPDAPIPVIHPAELALRAKGAGGAPFRIYVAARTPVRLRRLPRDAFRPLEGVTIGHGLPEAAYAGPGGLWRPILDRDGTLSHARFAAWLADGGTHQPDSPILEPLFARTPLLSRRTDPVGGNRFATHGFRGYAEPRPGVLVRDGRPEAAEALALWLDRDVALVGDAVMLRWRPYLLWNMRFGNRPGVPSALDDLPVSPANWPAMAALHRRLTGGEPKLGEDAWVRLADAWPAEPGADVRRAATELSDSLAVRVRNRMYAVRARAPGDPRLASLERLVPVLAELWRRADLGAVGLGRAGADDTATFRAAVALEAGMAGESAARSGIDHLLAYLDHVADRPTAEAEAADAAALSALAP